MAHEDWGHDGVDDEGEHDRAIQSAREDALVHLGQDEEEQHAAQDVEESEDEADVCELGARLGWEAGELAREHRVERCCDVGDAHQCEYDRKDTCCLDFHVYCCWLWHPIWQWKPWISDLFCKEIASLECLLLLFWGGQDDGVAHAPQRGHQQLKARHGVCQSLVEQAGGYGGVLHTVLVRHAKRLEISYLDGGEKPVVLV